jgi:2-dehydro-3-deoxyglucarate aldolase/4-hydroxy-2-oxoheptanedioate aldolase
MTTIKMNNGSVDLAFWMMTPNDAAADMATLLGMGVVIIDMEHGTFESASVARSIAYCRARSLKVFTRVDAAERVSVQHALDYGSDAVILPQIRDAAHAREATEYAKFPPLGVRGFGGGRTVNYVSAPSRFVAAENSRTQCWAMIETVAALEEIEEIAALPTVDGLFVGPNDLSLARGRGEYFADGADHDDIRRIAEAANRAGKPWAMPVASPKDRAFAASLNIAFMAVTDDLSALRYGLEQAVRSARDE